MATVDVEGLVSKPIVFVSDLGLRDEFVGVCASVIARIAPASRVVNLSHGVPPHDIMGGALLLAQCLPFSPEDAIALGVVDPVSAPGGARLDARNGSVVGFRRCAPGVPAPRRPAWRPSTWRDW